MKRLVLAGLIAGMALGAAGCTEGYGYGDVAVGYGSGGYYDPYYDGSYGGGYYGVGAPYYGWYGDFYYPGTGIYVYDRYRRPYRWNDNQRRYWQARSTAGRGGARRAPGNWNGFTRDGQRQPGVAGVTGRPYPGAAGTGRASGDVARGWRGNRNGTAGLGRGAGPVPPTAQGSDAVARGSYVRPNPGGAPNGATRGGGGGRGGGGWRGRGGQPRD